jgi:NAD(P)-dependent dehydrogenase (short-subunit alcohol dehydrogenase family)
MRIVSHSLVWPNGEEDLMTRLLEGKVAVVTGGLGSGHGHTLKMAKEGAAAVVIADRIETPREGGVATTELVPGRAPNRCK